MRDECADLLGGASDEGQPSDRAATRAEYIRLAVADRIDDVGQVIGLDLWRHRQGWIIDSALTYPVRIVGHHGVVLSQQVRQGCESSASHGLTDHEQQRA